MKCCNQAEPTHPDARQSGPVQPPLVHLQDHPTSHRPSQPRVRLNPACAHTSDSILRGTEPRARPRPSQSAACAPIEPTRPDRAVDPMCALNLCESAIFHGHSVILLYHQPFCYNELSHFTSLQPFLLHCSVIL
jgi:hypothetical protein